jgi:hypothetical protein
MNQHLGPRHPTGRNTRPARSAVASVGSSSPRTAAEARVARLVAMEGAGSVAVTRSVLPASPPHIFPRSRHRWKIGRISASALATASSALISARAAAANILGTRKLLNTSSTAALALPG